jgi:hypothetical protein
LVPTTDNANQSNFFPYWHREKIGKGTVQRWDIKASFDSKDWYKNCVEFGFYGKKIYTYI